MDWKIFLPAVAILGCAVTALQDTPVQLEITPFRLQNVQLQEDSAFHQATQLNRQYLLMLEPDRLLYSFRKTANLSTGSAQPYGGWIAANSEVRGHFTGHFLSATAMMWASTGDEQVRNKSML